MTLVVYSAVSAAAVLFVLASLARAVQYARAPLHLRWEVYPVPHEAPERVAHGGSYFEQSEWWRRPRTRHLLGEVRKMVPEILFLHALRTHNRPLWYRSFPFHFGLCLLAWTTALVFGAAIAAGRRAAALADSLTFRPTWSADHIQRPGETPTWAEVVASNPAREPRR